MAKSKAIAGVVVVLVLVGIGFLAVQKLRFRTNNNMAVTVYDKDGNETFHDETALVPEQELVNDGGGGADSATVDISWEATGNNVNWASLSIAINVALSCNGVELESGLVSGNEQTGTQQVTYSDLQNLCESNGIDIVAGTTYTFTVDVSMDGSVTDEYGEELTDSWSGSLSWSVTLQGSSFELTGGIV